MSKDIKNISPYRMYLKDMFDLGKPRITLFVCITALCAFYLASTNGVSWERFWMTAMAVFLVSFSSCCINQIMEIGLDEKMHRTQNRSLVTGRISIKQAWTLALVTLISGLGFMFWKVNLPAAIWLFSAWLGYVGFYTPLKMKTTLNTIVGAVVGALPPVVGWVAARGRLSFEAVLMFLMMFFWQMPHFLSIAWLYQEDYKRADMKMLTSFDQEGLITPRQSFLYCVALLPVVLLPTVFNLTGYIYLIASLALSVLFVVSVALFWKDPKRESARLVLLASVVYLPAVFIFMVIDKVG